MAILGQGTAPATAVTCRLSTLLGCLELTAGGDALVGVRIRPHEDTGCPAQASEAGLLKLAAEQIQEYLQGARREFTVPLRRPGAATAFQHRVWDAMLSIPYGTTRTYGDLARELATSPRAVGGACARNPLPLFVPCHRVVAKHGVGGYGGDWETGLAFEIKNRLLALEQRCPS